jgi:glucosamine--fructose-6-phosphate aminotransferase (isomerizing)
MRGSFAVCIVFSDAQDELFAAARGSPLVIGISKKKVDGQAEQNEFFVASDPLAVAALSRWFLYLKDGEIAHMSQAGGKDELNLVDFDLSPLPVKLEDNRLSSDTASKTGFPHFMLKEIHEQPTAVAQSLQAAGLLARQRHADLKAFFSDRLTLVACGTSHHATLVVRHFLEKYAHVSCQCELASEFLYRDPVVSGSYLFVSQSGETRDTVAAHDLVQERKCKTLAIVNVSTSQLARKANLVFTTQAGPEIGVASTKAFTSQIAVLMALLGEILDNEQVKAELKAELN